MPVSSGAMSRLPVAPRPAGPLLGLRDAERAGNSPPTAVHVRARPVRARSARGDGQTPAPAPVTTRSGARGRDLIDVCGAPYSRGTRRDAAHRSRGVAALLGAFALAACAGEPSPPPGWSGPFEAASGLARA